MQKIIRTSLLVFALASITYAGEMGNGVTNTPPPQTTNSSQVSSEPTTEGDIGYPVKDVAAEVALNLLQNLLALF